MLMILQKLLDVADLQENVRFSRQCSTLMILKKVCGFQENAQG